MARQGALRAREAVGVAGSGAPHELHGTDEDSICVGCGLCCDGTLLSHLAVVDESDLGRPLQALGVEIIVEADPPVFALPCPAFGGVSCTIYGLHRPHACGEFECDLSTAVIVGELSKAEARSVIVATRALRDRVRAGEAPEADLRVAVERHFRHPR
jgi:uncharacterized protein